MKLAPLFLIMATTAGCRCTESPAERAPPAAASPTWKPTRPRLDSLSAPRHVVSTAMRLPAGMYTVSDETRARFAQFDPFPLDLLFDRDDLGRGLSLVEQSDTEAWFRFPAGALLRVAVRGGLVVAAQVLELEAAAAATIERVLRLPLERAMAIRGALVAGARADEALDALFGPRRFALRTLADEAALGYRVRHLAVQHHGPDRWAVIELVESEGRVVAAELHEGQAAWDRLMAQAR